jgi:hypothetical protein
MDLGLEILRVFLKLLKESKKKEEIFKTKTKINKIIIELILNININININ